MSRDIDDLRHPEWGECTDHDRCIQRDNFKRNSLAVFDNAGTDLLDFISQPSFQVTRRDARAAVESMRRTNAALAAYIERLEAERDALLAEHDAYAAYREHLGRQRLWDEAWAAHDNAERVMHGE